MPTQATYLLNIKQYNHTSKHKTYLRNEASKQGIRIRIKSEL